MHESVTGFIFPVQDEMDVGIHEAESQDGYIIFSPDRVYAIHSPDKVGFIVENRIDFVAVGEKVPAIADADVLSLDEGGIQSKIRFDSPIEVVIISHTQTSRLL